MSEPGHIGWADLTVPDAEALRDFYAAVTGWQATPAEMGGYADFCMTPPGAAEPVAGICHARGPNAGLPPQWLIYITVANLDAALQRCRDLGGAVIAGPRGGEGSDRFAVIRDPADAVCALFQPKS